MAIALYHVMVPAYAVPVHIYGWRLHIFPAAFFFGSPAPLLLDGRRDWKLPLGNKFLDGVLAKRKHVPALLSMLLASMSWWKWKHVVAVVSFLFFYSFPLSLSFALTRKTYAVLCACCSIFVGAFDGYFFVYVAPFLLISIWTSTVIYRDSGDTRYWCIFDKHNRIYSLMCCLALCIWLCFKKIWYTRRKTIYQCVRRKHLQ